MFNNKIKLRDKIILLVVLFLLLGTIILISPIITDEEEKPEKPPIDSVNLTIDTVGDMILVMNDNLNNKSNYSIKINMNTNVSSSQFQFEDFSTLNYKLQVNNKNNSYYRVVELGENRKEFYYANNTEYEKINENQSAIDQNTNFELENDLFIMERNLEGELRNISLEKTRRVNNTYVYTYNGTYKSGLTKYGQSLDDGKISISIDKNKVIRNIKIVKDDNYLNSSVTYESNIERPNWVEGS